MITFLAAIDMMIEIPYHEKKRQKTDNSTIHISFSCLPPQRTYLYQVISALTALVKRCKQNFMNNTPQ